MPLSIYAVCVAANAAVKNGVICVPCMSDAQTYALVQNFTAKMKDHGSLKQTSYQAAIKG